PARACSGCATTRPERARRAGAISRISKRHELTASRSGVTLHIQLSGSIRLTELTLDRQAAELDRLLTALIKRYQFRDRNSICCGDVTVSQCYVLKELGRRGPLTMTALSRAMCLATSTLTRVVAQLERRGRVARRHPEGDRRVREVALTPAGAALLRS